MEATGTMRPSQMTTCVPVAAGGLTAHPTVVLRRKSTEKSVRMADERILVGNVVAREFVSTTD